MTAFVSRARLLRDSNAIGSTLSAASGSPLMEHEAIVKRVLVAHEAAPIDDMERLVALGQADPLFRAELLRGTEEVLDADPESLVPCWLVLVVGELGPAAFEPLLAAFGASDNEALDETILPVLMRHAGSAFDAITWAIEDSSPDEADYRADLYGLLATVARELDPLQQEQLRAFVLRRVDAWQTTIPPRDLEAEAEALTGLARRVTPELLQYSDPPDDENRDDAAARRGPAVRQILTGDWRDTARDVERRYGPGAERSNQRGQQ